MGAANLRRDVPRYIDHYLAGRLDLDGLISTEISLTDINSGFEAVRRDGGGRVVVTTF